MSTFEEIRDFEQKPAIKRFGGSRDPSNLKAHAIYLMAKHEFEWRRGKAAFV